MNLPQPNIATQDAGRPAATAGPRCRVAVEYAIEGDLRFLSHHDEVRMLTRALVRAGWPLAYSQGFNPLPRIALPLPRGVGIASGCQVAVVALHEPRALATLRDQLGAALPAGCSVKRLVTLAPGDRLHARGVTYEVTLEAVEAARVEPQLRGFAQAGPRLVHRESGPSKPARTVDIQPFVSEMVLDGCLLRLHLVVENQQSARPNELLTALGLAADAYDRRIRRVAVRWNMEFTGPAVGPVPPERTNVD